MTLSLSPQVLDNLQKQFGSIYTEKNVMISGTHSHSTPGGFMLDLLFDITAFGFVQETFDALVKGITKVIVTRTTFARVHFGKAIISRRHVVSKDRSNLVNPRSRLLCHKMSLVSEGSL